MKRMLLSEYQKRAFVGRPPAINTLKRMIERGDLLGEKWGNLWIVFVDDNGNAVQPTGNALADKVLQRWHSRRK